MSSFLLVGAERVLTLGRRPASLAGVRFTLEMADPAVPPVSLRIDLDPGGTHRARQDRVAGEDRSFRIDLGGRTGHGHVLPAGLGAGRGAQRHLRQGCRRPSGRRPARERREIDEPRPALVTRFRAIERAAPRRPRASIAALQIEAERIDTSPGSRRSSRLDGPVRRVSPSTASRPRGPDRRGSRRGRAVGAPRPSERR